MPAPRFSIEWETKVGRLTAIEPTPREIAAHAAGLARGYNDPGNAELMGHLEAISSDEVEVLYAESIAAGARAFLLFRDGELVGDGDLRGLRDGSAEFAFMIAAPAHQGKGLGTRFAIMIHAFGFATLSLERIYASVVPHNTASRRVFERLGYWLDTSPAARAYADEPTDVTLAIDRPTFAGLHTTELAQLQITART